MAWLTVGLYIATIFVTLPFAPLLWSALSAYSQISFRLVTAFVILLPLTGCIFFILRQNRGGWRVAGLLLLAVLSLLIIIFFAETSAETLHLLEYGGLSYLTLRAAKPYTYRAYLFCLLFVLFVGSVDEAIQFTLPNRVFQVKDILLNGLCGVIGLATTTLLHPSP